MRCGYELIPVFFNGVVELDGMPELSRFYARLELALKGPEGGDAGNGRDDVMAERNEGRILV